MLRLCDMYASHYKIMFNAGKSRCMRFAPKYCSHSRPSREKPLFYINNHAIEYVDKWSHLGHIISSDRDDKSDILNRRNALLG